MNVLWVGFVLILCFCFSSLEKQGDRRATPWRMLEHPWMLEMKTKKPNMALFLQKVWQWPDESSGNAP